MKASRLPLLRLALLCLLAVALLWVLRLRRQQAPEIVPDAMGPGAGFGETVRFVFSGNGDSLVIARTEGGYEVIHPFRDRGDREFLAEVSRRARDLRPVRVLPDTAGSRYGLVPPRSRLSLLGSSGERWSVALGDSAPVGSAIYARTSRSGGHVLLVERYTARRYFVGNPVLVRDRFAAQLHGGPLDSILVRTPGHELRARRISAESWKARAPALDLDPVPINRVLEAMRGPAIVGYPDPGMPRSALGLDPPRAVWVLFQGSRAETILVGNPTPDQKKVYVVPAGRNAPAVMQSDFFRTLVDGWSALADRHLLAVKPESLQAIEFLGDPKAGSYRYAQRHWRRLPSGRLVPDQDALDQQVRNLALLEWRFYPARETPAPAGRSRLRLRLVSPSRIDTLILAAPIDSVGLARSSLRPRWGEVSAYTWRIWRYRCDHPE